jgi:hypothetical protein
MADRVIRGMDIDASLESGISIPVTGASVLIESELKLYFCLDAFPSADKSTQSA